MSVKKPIVDYSGKQSEILASDTIPISNLGTGTPDGTKFLRDDGVFATPAGGGGGGNSTTQTVDFGASFTDKAQVVVTGQSWVTSSSEIVAHIKTPSTVDPDEIRLLEFQIVISDLVNGVGFTITVYSEPEATGTYDVMCIGV
jgi:hypothetical protein